MQFPLSRVKKIIKADTSINSCSTDAAVLCTTNILLIYPGSLASELFLEHLADKAHINVLQDKRKVLQYKDLAKVCANDEQFEFLEEVVPFPMPLVSAMQLAAKDVEDRKKHAIEDLKVQAVNELTNHSNELK